jgi:hypothetical protein
MHQSDGTLDDTPYNRSILRFDRAKFEILALFSIQSHIEVCFL